METKKHDRDNKKKKIDISAEGAMPQQLLQLFQLILWQGLFLAFLIIWLFLFTGFMGEGSSGKKKKWRRWRFWWRL